jgi:predicted N-acetyltransferase YhbS
LEVYTEENLSNRNTLNPRNDAVVRDALPGELDEVGELTIRAFREYRALVTPQFINSYEQDIRDVSGRVSKGSVLVAELGGQIVGAVTLLADGSGYGMHGWPVAWPVIRLLAVDPAARGRRIGTLLAAACVDRARHLGVPTLGLHTAPFMAAARALYEALGFERAPEYDVVQPGSPPALAYRLELGRLGIEP